VNGYEYERKDAILKPIESDDCPVKLSDDAVNIIINLSEGYPYFM